ncbi:unnamed protein product [Meloidogyne enterolobii]|uniref:Uncharacterized protein n=1 Tax=Meloidogyne enterolobii TaxID=390850 RepID=A0ACB1B1Z6_MELEN
MLFIDTLEAERIVFYNDVCVETEGVYYAFTGGMLVSGYDSFVFRRISPF